MDKFFKLKENNTTVKTEIFAGLTTFFAMAYIIFVNPNQVAAEGATGWLAQIAGLGTPVANQLGQIWNSVYIASILVAVVGTLLMAFYAKLPFAQACGMGLNAFFCTTFVSGAFFGGNDVIQGYQAGLVIIFLSGVVFLVLSATGAREYIAKAMPKCLKAAIPAGIGLFIAFIGLQNAGIVQGNQYTLLQFFDFNGAIDSLGTVNENGVLMTLESTGMLSVIVALVGFIIIAILSKRNIKGSMIIGIIASTVLYYVLLGKAPSFDVSGVSQSFKDFGAIGVTGVFHGEAWANAFSPAFVGGVFNAIVLIITFCLVDMFDTIGTLYGTASQANMLDENGDPVRVNKAMMADSIGTVTGAVLGTSTCTTFVESAAGVAEGGRTGLTSLVTAICFAVCLFLSPLAAIVPSAATAPALMYVGVLMLKNFSKVDMDDILSAVPAFVTLLMMPLTYSIANGIGLGAISYVLIAIFTGKYTKRDIMVTLIALLFVFKFCFVTM